jgi:pyruvate ferredoxin oxidoreductase beta subunit
MSGVWILFEIENGKLQLSGPSKNLVDPEKRAPIEDYLKVQGRFDGMTTDDIQQLKKWVNHQWDKYLRLQ